MAGEFNTDDPRYTALYIGQVVDREDPEGLGRVRVRVPGLVEPASAWAFPLGTVGGGSEGRGFFAIPEQGAEVGILFHQGDIDHPYYLSGHWGKPAGQTEVPGPVRGLAKQDVPRVRAFETERFILVFDDRAGSERLLLKDKSTGDLITIDAGVGIRVKTTKDLRIEVDGDLAVAAKGNAAVSVDGDVAINVRGTAKVDAGSQAVVTAPDVELGGLNLVAPVHGLVLGGGIDPFTGLTYATLGSASRVVKAKK
jgi:uncharacterized protein involved in type VI secretion and phage assembly